MLGAAVIHVSQVRVHFLGWFAAGLTFIVLTVVELVLAVAVTIRPSRRVLLAAILTSLATVMLWAVSRTIGLPFGPQRFVAEAVGKADMTATLLESATVFLLTPLAARAGHAETRGARSLGPSRVLSVGVIGVAVSTITWFAIQEPTWLCGSGHGSDGSLTGPIVPIDGHSILSRYTPVAEGRAGKATGLVVGLLKNCGSEPADILSARLLGTTDVGAAVKTGGFWLVPPTLARPGELVPIEQLKAQGAALPGLATVPSASGSDAYPGLVLEVKAVQPGTLIVDGVELSYRSGDASFTAPYADIARLHVRRANS